jgi:hypothetical protein
MESRLHHFQQLHQAVLCVLGKMNCNLVLEMTLRVEQLMEYALMRRQVTLMRRLKIPVHLLELQTRIGRL